jgi:ribonuclease Z
MNAALCSWLKYVLLALAVISLAVSANSQNFKVTLLGTGYPRPVMERFGPSILVEAGKEKLLFDCGRGSTQRLYKSTV